MSTQREELAARFIEASLQDESDRDIDRLVDFAFRLADAFLAKAAEIHQTTVSDHISRVGGDDLDPDAMKAVTVGQVDEIRVDREPLGLPDQAADGIPKMTVTVEKTAQGNLEAMR